MPAEAFSLKRFFDVNERQKRSIIPKQIVTHYADWLTVIKNNLAAAITNLEHELVLAEMFVEREPKWLIGFGNLSDIKHRSSSFSVS